MQTQVMLDSLVGAPWLERDAADGGSPLRTPLEDFPFSIGWNESSALPLASGRVSRDHAVIHRVTGGYPAEMCLELGCGLGQGDYFGPPRPLDGPQQASPAD